MSGGGTSRPVGGLPMKRDQVRAMSSLLALSLFAALAWAEVTVTKQRMVDLGGAWQFATDPEGRLAIDTLDQVEKWRAIEVPSSWQAQFADLIGYDGVAWYRRSFIAPAGGRDFTLRLRFGAVNYRAEVWLNGQQVGSHEGGYTPFALDVTPYLRRGAENALVVRVIYPSNDRSRYPDFPFDEIPSGKQGHYCRCGGIWQRVWLEARPNPYIESVRVRPDIDHAVAQVGLRLAWSEARKSRATAARLRVLDAQSKVVAREIIPVQAGQSEYDLMLRIPKAHRWAPEDPYLYTIEAAPMAANAPTERVTDTFGMRKIEVRDHRIYLNNHPVFLAGALDQAFYPRTIYQEPSEAELEQQFRKAKHLGLNFLRTHIKVPDPRYCAAADRVGLMLWIDMPNFWHPSAPARERLANTLRDTIERDFNHPSIFAWCLVNEEWGVSFEDAAQREWLKGLWREAKRLDPTRLVVDNSPAGAGHVISDIEDQHVYMAMPEKRREFERWCDEFATHPAYTFRWPDSERRGFEPLMISEFGNWGLPEIAPILDFYGGKDPYWFNQHGYGGPIRPGVERFHEWHLDDVFGSFDAMARQMQWHQYAALKTQIEIMRRHPEIVGYVITQFTDLNSESNGLLTMTRRAKQYHDVLRMVQAPDAIVPVWERCAFWPGEELALPVRVSHFSTLEITDATLRWWLDGSGVRGEVKGVAVSAASAPEVATIRFTIPDTARPELMRMQLELVGNGAPIAETSFDFAVIPTVAKRAPVGLTCAVQASQALNGIAERLREAGAMISDSAPLEVACVLDAALAQRLARGARVLLLASPKSIGETPFSPLQVEDRGARSWWGDWMSNVNWQRSDLFPRLPQSNVQGMAYESVVPRSVISSVGPCDSQDILAGIFTGWMHDPAALTAQFRVGEGVLLATTFELASGYGSDPMATAMLHDLLAYLASERAAPTAKLDLSGMGKVRVALPTAEVGEQVWRYATTAPPPGWEQPGFDDRGWQQGAAGFGTAGTPNTTVRTVWNRSDIWLRTEFALDVAPRRAALRFYHDENAEFYLNGENILKRGGHVTNYQTWELPAEARAHLRAGRNVLAIHCRQTAGGQYIDAGLSVLD